MSSIGGSGSNSLCSLRPRTPLVETGLVCALPCLKLLVLVRFGRKRAPCSTIPLLYDRTARTMERGKDPASSSAWLLCRSSHPPSNPPLALGGRRDGAERSCARDATRVGDIARTPNSAVARTCGVPPEQEESRCRREASAECNAVRAWTSASISALEGRLIGKCRARTCVLDGRGVPIAALGRLTEEERNGAGEAPTRIEQGETDGYTCLGAITLRTEPAELAARGEANPDLHSAVWVVSASMARAARTAVSFRSSALVSASLEARKSSSMASGSELSWSDVKPDQATSELTRSASGLDGMLLLCDRAEPFRFPRVEVGRWAGVDASRDEGASILRRGGGAAVTLEDSPSFHFRIQAFALPPPRSAGCATSASAQTSSARRSPCAICSQMRRVSTSFALSSSPRSSRA
eukprot:scaffold291949_cov24-Tisochrysis_lutea.AAC.3